MKQLCSQKNICSFKVDLKYFFKIKGNFFSAESLVRLMVHVNINSEPPKIRDPSWRHKSWKEIL